MSGKKFLACLLLTASLHAPAFANEEQTVSVVKSELPPLYQAELDRAEQFVSGMMAGGIIVPQPKDPGGGYSHEQHKRNYRAMYLAGQLFQITGDQRYADYIRDMLLQYAELYPTLGDHPAAGGQAPGRLFWQVLNDAVWLVHSIQAYGAIRDGLSVSDRERIDNDVFRRAAEFLSVDSRSTFDKIHNHATWASAGVGMTGYLLGDDDLVQRALLGSDKSGKTGFLRQTQELFSPDGYYTEGPYYQRYALLPFMVFADVIDQNDPNFGIFEFRDGILLKALRTTIQLTYGGYFFPFNDAIRDKSLNTDELYNGVAIAYAESHDPELLSIAALQGRTVLTRDGLELARDLNAGKAKPFNFTSMLLTDGPKGKDGAVAIMRHGQELGPEHTALVVKNASQGMGHGHFDKLSWQLYDRGNEIVRDYGAARFLNIEAKRGGTYLPENTSWAKQSIAHNTLVINEKSHFGANVKLADASAPTQLYYSALPDLQISTASIGSAYPDEGASMLRTLALVDIEGLSAPVVVDVLKASSAVDSQFDLPLHYSGHIMDIGFDARNYVTTRPVLGEDNGYQHIWVDAIGSAEKQSGFMTWLLDGRFYTYRFVPQLGSEVILGESGANDPEFNLRREPLILQRLRGKRDATFVSVLESHGLSDGAAELVTGSNSQIATLQHYNQAGSDIVIIKTLAGKKTALAISYDTDPSKAHSVTVDGHNFKWKGFASRIEIEERAH